MSNVKRVFVEKKPEFAVAAKELGHEIRCSRVIRALTVPRSISWRRTSAGGCPASRQRAEKRSFRSGLSRVLTTYLWMRPMPTFGRPPCLLYVFFGVSMISGL